MRRREVIPGLLSAAAWPSVARAQPQPSKRASIGYLGAQTAAAEHRWITAFTTRLTELGWRAGENLAVEYRWGEGRDEPYAAIAAEFVRLKVDVIVTQGTRAALAAKQTTSTIPIVFTTAGDPVGTGLVESLARPSGNVTGLSSQMGDTAAKRLELLREVVPSLRRVAVLGNVENRINLLEISEVSAAAQRLGLESIELGIRRAEDIQPSVDSVKGRVEALYVATDPLTNSNSKRISGLALAEGLPTIFGVTFFAEAGGLVSYGVSFTDQYRRAAEYVDKILRGERPGDLPVSQPVKFELIINLKTARALGLTIPPTLLARADEVIE